MNKHANRVSVLLAGIIALLMAPSGMADATPAAAVKAAKSVCETGYRGMPEYDRKCLKTGTFKMAANLWLSIPAGDPKHVGREDFTRRSICKFPGTFGTRAAVREALTDVTYDSIRNYRQSLNWSADVAVLDCKSMGYKIK